MRKAFSLIEVILGSMLILTLAGLSAPTVSGLAAAMTRSAQAIQSDVTLGHLLGRLRQDVQAGRSLELRPGPEGAVLLIEQDGARVRYERQEGRVLRLSAGADGQADGRERTQWDLPRAQVDWAAHLRADRAVGLEVRTGVALEEANRKLRIARTAVLFLGLDRGR